MDNKTEKFIDALETAYIVGKDVTLVEKETGRTITIAHSAIPMIRLWFIEVPQVEKK
jgi:hypothetical protein